ncbi:glycosyltransferase family 2 protein [Roseicyclus sp.]|uniref:glycosyltransferase family 2 protein n=1 Tax=Roseicyclus sp. TaxID=1914329 RepID=UPI003FA0CFDF
MSAFRRVGVVIPFYQREAGILSRALGGVAAQVLPEGVALRVYVVDDGSPRPATTELSDWHARLEIVLIEQANGGPGRARNAALDRIEADGDVDLVAFLDSDDVWHPQHIADAIAALGHGYDFYCCDNVRPGTYALFSEHFPVLAGGGAGLAARSVVVDPEGPVRGFAPQELCDDVAVSYLSHTSTVVLRAGAIGDLRFDPDLRSAGEDRMFWLMLALAGARVAISWRVNVTCGQGVNLFFSAHDWNSPATVERLGCELLFAEKLLRHEILTEARRNYAKSRARRSRRAYSFLFLRMLVRLRPPPLGTFRRLLAFDPLLPLRMPPLFLGVLLDRRPAGERL